MYAYPMTPNNTINSTKKIFLLLQAEPKLRTVTGDLLLAADDVFGTPLHYGSQRQSSTFCRSVVAYYMCEYGNFLNRFNTYLCSIKKKFPSFYSSKDLRKLIFEYAAPPTMKKLHALLATKNKNGITAYELWSQKTAYKDENLEPLELLNPDTCSYKSKRAEVITCEIEPKFELMQQFYNAMQSKKRSLCI